jgi:MFS family permease
MLAVGAAIGGVFSQAFGRRASFVADAVSFVLAGLLIVLISRPMQRAAAPTVQRPAVHPISDMREALSFARRDKVILALLASKATFGIGSGVVSQLAVLASTVFHSGDAGRGLLIGARGLGAGLGPLIAIRLCPDVRSDRGISRALLVCGAAGCLFAVTYVGAAWAPTIVLSAVCVTLAHLGGGAQWSMSTYGLQMRSPDVIRGRVMAGDFAIVTLVLSLTSFAAGAVSQAIGVRAAITIFAAIAGASSIVYLTLISRLRSGLSANAEASATDVATTRRL